MRTLTVLLLAFAILVAFGAPAAAVVQSGGPGAGNGVPTGNGGNTTFTESKPTLVGTSFDIAVSDGMTTKLSHLTFKTKDLSCDYFERWSITAVPYTENSGKGKTVSFTGKLADAAGNGLEVSGSVTAEGAITGSFDVTKKGEKQSYTFSGGSPGSDGAKAARAEVDAAKKAKKK
jgi:hypothetical protein